MNDQQSFEREVATWIAAEGTDTAPDQTLDDILTATSRKRPLPGWLALIKEPPMRISNSVTVGSPMVRVAAIMVATLLLAIMVAGAGLAGSRLLAADGPIIVAQDGSGDFTTVGEAVAASDDGATLLIRPGTYDETVRITADIEVIGDAADRAEIVITALQVTGSEASISHLSATNISVSGGAPTLTDLVAAIDISDGAAGTVAESDFSAGLEIKGGASPVITEGLGSVVAIEDASPRLIGNTFSADGTSSGALIMIEGDAAPLLQANTISVAGASECAVGVEDGGSVTLRENTIRDSDTGVCFGGSSATIEENHFHDNIVGLRGGNGVSITGNTFDRHLSQAILVDPSDAAVIDGNAFAENRIGISVSGEESQVSPGEQAGLVSITNNELYDSETAAIVLEAAIEIVKGNTILGGGDGIQIGRGLAPTLIENVVEETRRGVFVGSGGTPTLIGNRLCNNETNLATGRSGAEPILENNEICEEAPAG